MKFCILLLTPCQYFFNGVIEFPLKTLEKKYTHKVILFVVVGYSFKKTVDYGHFYQC